MASLAPYNITLGGTDYPAKYAALLAYIEPFLTNLETFSFSGGNVGLGVTPGTWASTAKAFDFSFPAFGQDSAGSAFMSFNARESSSGNWVYKTSDEASRFVANVDGGFRFFTAPSGTAGNAISFTQAMTLTSGGDLLVGTTALSGAGGLTLQKTSDTVAIISNSNAATSGNVMHSFRRSGVEIGSITQNGTTAVLYNTTSDRRLKDNIAAAPSASDVIDAIEIVSHDWKAAPDEHVTYGVIAQDLALVAPQAVLQGDDGEEVEKTWGVDYSKLVPMLIKEIQSLRARVAALEQA
jgi:hypothetical protein